MTANHLRRRSTWTTFVTVGLSIVLILGAVLSIGQGLARAGESLPPAGAAHPADIPTLGDWRVAPGSWADQVPAIALGASSYYLVVWDSYRSSPGTTGRDIYGLRVQTNGTLWASPIPICTANGDQHAPDLAYNPVSGHFLVVWYDYRGGRPDIYGQRVDSFGNLIGSEIAICTAAYDQYRPRVAYNSDDNEYLVVWQDHRTGSAADGRIYGRRISATGTLLSSEIVIASGTGSKILPAVDYSANLHRYMVVWGDYRNGNCDIYGRGVQETGTLDPEKAICTAPGDQRHAAVSLNGFNYNWLVVWQDGRNLSTNGYDIYGRLVDNDGDPIGSELVIAAGSQDEDLPRLVYNVNISPPVEREWLVVWHDQNVSLVGGIQARRVYGTGAFDGASFTVSAGDATATAPAVCYDDTWGTNTYLVVWEDYRGGDYGEVFGQRVNDDASLEGDPRGISKWTDQSDAALAYNPDNDEYLLVWRDQRGGDYDIWGRRLDGFGNPIGLDFFIGGGSGVQWSPDVAYSSYARRYLVVWTSDYDEVWGQVIEFDGVFLGNNFAICTATGFKWSPAVASSNSDKGFLVAWTDDRYSSSDIFGRGVTNNGTLGASELLICTNAAEQADPAIAYAPSTGTDADPYLVVWRDERNGATNRDIYARRVFRPANTGGDLGAEFAVTTAADHQEYPAVDYNPYDDEFLVVWQYRAGGTQDIYGQRVDPSGAIAGTPFPICTQADAQWNPAVAYSPVGETYLVVWEDSRNVVTDIYGTRVGRGGGVVSGDFGICTADRSQNYPDLAYGSTQDFFLVTWSDDRTWWRSDDIYARSITGRILPYDNFLPLLFREYYNPYVSLLSSESVATGVSAAGLFAVVALGLLITIRRS